jgi:xanthine dehydrogenase accessory factor
MKMKDIFTEITRLKQAQIPAALVTVVGTRGSVPRETGAKMIVMGDGDIIGTVGGSEVEQRAITEAQEAIRDGNPRKIVYTLHEDEKKGDKTSTGMICGGEMEIYIEPINVTPTLYLFGGGHVNKPTARIASMCGFGVVAIDPRKEMANSDRFPDADEILNEDFGIASSKIETKGTEYIVIATPGHSADYDVLKNLLGKPFRYLGLISSKKKRSTFFDRLRKDGFNEEQIGKIHAPIGIDINSETPEEIAVSIVAELIKIRNMK